MLGNKSKGLIKPWCWYFMLTRNAFTEVYPTETSPRYG